MLLIGSQAMRWSNPNWASYRFQNIQDYDLICLSSDFKQLVKSVITAGNKLIAIEYRENKGIAKFINKSNELVVIDASFIDKEGSLATSDEWIYSEYQYLFDENVEFKHLNTVVQCKVAPVVLCFILKESHKFKKDSPHFEKTRDDLLYFYNVLNFNRNFLSDVEKKILDHREKLTYNNNLPKLNQNKKDFFTDSVPYKYDHDTIHEAVKHLDKPAYRYYIKENEEVMCDVNKWNELPEIVKLYGVLEESYVLALERSIIPFESNHKQAFEMALQKVCTSITSGWFRQFAWDNYDKVKQLYHPSFVIKFEQALAAGRIADYKKEVAAY